MMKEAVLATPNADFAQSPRPRCAAFGSPALRPAPQNRNIGRRAVWQYIFPIRFLSPAETGANLCSGRGWCFFRNRSEDLRVSVPRKCILNL